MLPSFVRQYTLRPVVLTKDNCGPLGAEVIVSQTQVTITTPFSSGISLQQQIDMGIKAVRQLRYKLRYSSLSNSTTVEISKIRSHNREGSALFWEGHKNVFKWKDPVCLVLLKWQRKARERLVTWIKFAVGLVQWCCPHLWALVLWQVWTSTKHNNVRWGERASISNKNIGTRYG